MSANWQYAIGRLPRGERSRVMGRLRNLLSAKIFEERDRERETPSSQVLIHTALEVCYSPT